LRRRWQAHPHTLVQPQLHLQLNDYADSLANPDEPSRRATQPPEPTPREAREPRSTSFGAGSVPAARRMTPPPPASDDRTPSGEARQASAARRTSPSGTFRVQGSGFRVQGVGCGVQDSGFRVQGSGSGAKHVPTRRERRCRSGPSPIRKRLPLGPYSRPMPRDLWRP
jgi:hypothetical protein